MAHANLFARQLYYGLGLSANNASPASASQRAGAVAELGVMKVQSQLVAPRNPRFGHQALFRNGWLPAPFGFLAVTIAGSFCFAPAYLSSR
jgi:hypothetical protein